MKYKDLSVATARNSLLDKINGKLFGWFVEKVKVQWIVVVMFVLKAGVEVMEILY